MDAREGELRGIGRGVAGSTGWLSSGLALPEGHMVWSACSDLAKVCEILVSVITHRPHSSLKLEVAKNHLKTCFAEGKEKAFAMACL